MTIFAAVWRGQGGENRRCPSVQYTHTPAYVFVAERRNTEVRLFIIYNNFSYVFSFKSYSYSCRWRILAKKHVAPNCFLKSDCRVNFERILSDLKRKQKIVGLSSVWLLLLNRWIWNFIGRYWTKNIPANDVATPSTYGNYKGSKRFPDSFYPSATRLFKV